VRASSISLFAQVFTARRRRRLAAMTMLLLVIPVLAGCVRIKASITISPDDLVSGEIIAAAKPRNDKDAGPQLDPNLPFSQKVAISKYDTDGYVGSQAVFSDLTFAELPELAHMNADAQGVNLSLRRAGDLVILEGRADLTSLTDPEADVELTVAFPGTVTSTNGDRVDPDGAVETQTGHREQDDRSGPLHRSEHPLVPRRRALAGPFVARGRGRGGAAGLVQPRPLAPVRRAERPAVRLT
jgi:hypothetical protein